MVTALALGDLDAVAKHFKGENAEKVNDKVNMVRHSFISNHYDSSVIAPCITQSTTRTSC